ncbi:MAG TPA: hypothetical protein VE687_03145 [Stellaceae bacterium]|nr:hypothetical protein [Stellaceae bacterium]
MTTDWLRGNDPAEIAKANSIPLALIGIGVAWLVASNTGLANRVVNDERVQTARRRIGEIAGNIVGGGPPPAEEAQPPIFGPDGEPLTPSTAAARRNGWVHQAAGAAKGAISSARDAGSTALDRASDYAGDASDLARRASGQVAQRLERDPWLVGVAGFVAGALVAALLPSTRIERECIGEARNELRNRAVELGHEAAERVRELADATVRAARQ